MIVHTWLCFVFTRKFLKNLEVDVKDVIDAKLRSSSFRKDKEICTSPGNS
jgi:hypothetical protein